MALNPFSTLVSLILLSIISSMMSDLEALVFLFFVLFLPLFFRINLFTLLWKMKVMVITAILIFVFAITGDKSLLSALSSTAKFLSVIALSALYVEKADLLDLSTTMGSLLSPIMGKAGRKAASSLMMTIALFPIIFFTGSEMMNARKSRGGSFFRHPVSGISSYTISLMRLLFQKVLIFQDALYSRSWSTGGERTPVKLTRRDTVFILVSFLLFVWYLLWKKVF